MPHRRCCVQDSLLTPTTTATTHSARPAPCSTHSRTSFSSSRSLQPPLRRPSPPLMREFLPETAQRSLELNNFCSLGQTIVEVVTIDQQLGLPSTEILGTLTGPAVVSSSTQANGVVTVSTATPDVQQGPVGQPAASTAGGPIAYTYTTTDAAGTSAPSARSTCHAYTARRCNHRCRRRLYSNKSTLHTFHALCNGHYPGLYAMAKHGGNEHGSTRNRLGAATRSGTELDGSHLCSRSWGDRWGMASVCIM